MSSLLPSGLFMMQHFLSECSTIVSRNFFSFTRANCKSVDVCEQAMTGYIMTNTWLTAIVKFSIISEIEVCQGEKNCLRKSEACSGSTTDSKVICQCPLLCYFIVHQIKKLVSSTKKKTHKIKQISLPLATYSSIPGHLFYTFHQPNT